MHLSWKVIFSSVIQIVIIVKGIFSVFDHRMFVEQLEPELFFWSKTFANTFSFNVGRVTRNPRV